MYKARIIITLKEIIPDQEGEALLQACHDLSLNKIKQVRTGHYIEMVIDSENKLDAEKQLKAWIESALYNQVIEQFKIQLEEIK
ncbi:phosphoribosylformylglycinamidine synthase subunit PurS [Heliorestis convoluta]|uniref:Phosphoribosylformylglycinamidine synthase subunit PurS n=1 Tax=Heliorestis convoluta TaxID=356322 RepID=A0A5Q2N163_9FIRM|nr:phosphoribosylformylglycinamidine synthase subunit PurS [Heliorestis convoluta]QGG46285.1 phosphoribosylformylglycinamidine synthase, purS protein [Heliorestis convoluta]